ncbi:MAG: transposase [Acidobacteriia bacterium]|nr:transposase [Terriglobia bacterium]
MLRCCCGSSAQAQADLDNDSSSRGPGAGAHGAGQRRSLLSAIEELSEGICEYNERIEALPQTSYPQVELLKQIKGVGTLIALTFLLTLEDPHRFGKSRDVSGYLGLQPGRRKS